MLLAAYRESGIIPHLSDEQELQGADISPDGFLPKSSSLVNLGNLQLQGSSVFVMCTNVRFHFINAELQRGAELLPPCTPRIPHPATELKRKSRTAQEEEQFTQRNLSVPLSMLPPAL